LDDGVRVDLEAPGEPATILWLPWKQGELRELVPFWVEQAAPGTVFLTYYLSGCKLFSIHGGPTWHIDAQIEADLFWPRIAAEEWVEDYWPAGTSQHVAYLHRAGQPAALWDLSGFLEGAAPTTYGNGNVGQAIVGGVVNDDHKLDLYYQTSPWKPLGFASQRRLK
jgi:hypothetical protein